MKTFTLSLFLVLNAFLAYSQDWSPFVKDQLSYYKQLNSDQSYSIKNIVLDSVNTTGNETKWYFDSKSILNGKCRKSFQSGFYNELFYINIEFDSLISRNDSVLFIYGYDAEPDTFLFKPWADVNESWVTHDATTIECISKGITTVLGETDSVKTFTVKNSTIGDKEFILSKNHGFIKFIPFVFYVDETSPLLWKENLYYELAGYENAGIKKGYTKPEFKDYFNLKPGDIIYKQIYNDPYQTDITEWGLRGYKVDSITYAYHSEDSVYYEYKRHHLDLNKKIVSSSNSSVFYKKSYWNKYIEKNVNNVLYTGYIVNEYDVEFFQSLIVEFGERDTVSTAHYLYEGVSLDTTNCESVLVMDIYFNTFLSTKTGYANDVIGYKINGVEDGEIVLSTVDSEISLEEFNVYPNPASEELKINIPNGQSFAIELFTIDGELMLKQKDVNKIDLSGYSTGLYLLVIKQENTQKQFKINHL